MDDHSNCVMKLCRVCAEIISKQRVTHDCKEKADILAKYMNIDVHSDDPAIHPPRFCNKCYCTLKRVEQHGTKTALMAIHWTGHSAGNCETCGRYSKGSKGGRKRKAQKGGNYSGVTNAQMIQVINSLSLLPPYATSNFTPISPSRFCTPPLPIQLKDFVCSICKNILSQPIETMCRHMMCKLCLSKRLLENSTKPSCPVCSKEFKQVTNIRPPTTALTNILSRLELHCDHPFCKSVVPLCTLREHVTQCSPVQASQVLVVPVTRESPQSTPGPMPSQQPSPVTPAPLTPSKISLQSVLESPLDKTLLELRR